MSCFNFLNFTWCKNMLGDGMMHASMSFFTCLGTEELSLDWIWKDSLQLLGVRPGILLPCRV